MSDTITGLPLASTIDPTQDWIAIDTTSLTSTQRINRNTYLNLGSAPVGLTDSQTLTNKTLTSPAISGPTLSGTLIGTYTIGGTPTFPVSVVQLTSTQTLTNKTLTSPTINSPTITNATISADTITGFTTSNTGTIYGISVTTGQITTTSSVLGGALTNSSVTASKLATGAATSTIITTNETTASTSFVDLTTTTDTVTVTIGVNGLALVVLYTELYNDTATGHAICGFAVSGASTIAATQTQAIDYQIATSSGSTTLSVGASFLVTGLTSGSNTFKMKYAQSTAGTAHFLNRKISVVPL